MIRLAKPSDAAPMLAIYSPYIQHTSITFETETPAVTDFAERIETYLRNWPWLAFEKDGILAGYAYASRYRERVAYQWSVECSVYIHDDYLRQGIAAKLYSALFAILARQGFMNVYAVINLPNDRSVAFHENMGFRWFATYEKVGYKLGQWKNVGWWGLQLNEYIDNPPTPIPLSALDKSIVQPLLDQI
ncbi:MAG TPA: GNAT family N-acetyltransferase [Chitinophagaceae bacterium]|nr:GNAT family N-acetyltransferase [Chitinophagaceae bacterium]